MSAPSTSLSFTGAFRVRFPAPDVARGFMLLLIALANVPFWMPASETPLSQQSIADQVWVAVRTALVDQRAYPLFAFLFGFGLVTMINRRVQTEVNQGVPLFLAVSNAGRLVRRRGWWMLAIGAVHALVFFGDIIGAYGLVAVVLSWLLTRKRYGVLWGISGVITVLALLMSILEGYMSGLTLATSSESAGLSQLPEFGLLTPLFSLLFWLIGTPLTLAFTLVVPAVVIGARVAETSLIPQPGAHKRLGGFVAVGGLLFAVIGSIPEVISLVTGGYAPVWGPALNLVAGLGGALGWVALLSLWAGGPPASGVLTGLRGFLANVGQRSMTAYLLQTVFFGLFFWCANAAGWTAGWGPASGALVAVVVWLVIAALCQWMARDGKRGPMERLLRWLVARGDVRPGPFVPPPPSPAPQS